MRVAVSWTEVEAQSAEFEVDDDFDPDNEQAIRQLIATESGHRSVIVDGVAILS